MGHKEHCIHLSREIRYPAEVKNASFGVMQFLSETEESNMVGLGGAIALSSGYLLITAHQVDAKEEFTLFERSGKKIHTHNFTQSQIDSWGYEGIDIATVKLPSALRHTIPIQASSYDYSKDELLYVIGFPYDTWNPAKKPQVIPVEVSLWTSYHIYISYDIRSMKNSFGCSGGALVSGKGMLLGIISEAEERPNISELKAINIDFFQHALR